MDGKYGPNFSLIHRTLSEVKGYRNSFKVGLDTTGNFWSSTENSNTPSNAWNVNLNNGNTNNNAKTNSNATRCVRRDLLFGPTAASRQSFCLFLHLAQ